MRPCFVCGHPCEGTTGAVIEDVFQPMCHEGPDPTCYQTWCQQDSTARLLTAIFGKQDDA